MTINNCNWRDLFTNGKQTSMAFEKATRKWEIFQGRNRFYCSGRLMTAPNAGVFFLTVFLITGTCALFFIFDCKYLAENVTIAIPIIGTVLFLFTMSSLLRTSLSDPGIIPRATSEEAAYVEKQIEVTNSANSPTYRPPPRTKEVLVKGQTIKLKYCFTCKLFRPPRASHCSICDNCVDRFDHHCPWVGNCVGRRNYRFFYMFIVSLAFLAVFIFACAVAHLILITREDRQFLDAVKESPPSVIVAVICFFSVWSIIGLAGFHTYLTTSNQTTNEDIKGSFTGKRGQESFNPYSRGNVCLNCFHILCGPVTPSLIDRRGVVTDSYRSEITHPIISEPAVPLKTYGMNSQNGANHIITNASETPGIYRQTTEATDSNAGSVTQLMTNEQPIAVGPALQRPPEDSLGHYKSQPSLNHSPLYNNVTPSAQTMSRSHSYANDINSMGEKTDDAKIDIEDLQLDPVVVRETHILATINDRSKYRELKLDNDLTASEKENSLLSASRLRLLQDTTMIESALDLDSLEDSSLGTGSHAGLMKVVV
ncbi:palmitoyltransferase app isoform X3 [Cylas formicarius]|uniref:palmitoyltransferase app isoform X3 n=1 Tax=Cylas formicarius TaxID=197179 RepID=UPI002958ABFE|nr:palmitoyltransferase app isoform X3 [Cylas formicarius]